MISAVSKAFPDPLFRSSADGDHTAGRTPPRVSGVSSSTPTGSGIDVDGGDENESSGAF